MYKDQNHPNEIDHTVGLQCQDLSNSLKYEIYTVCSYRRLHVTTGLRNKNPNLQLCFLLFQLTPQSRIYVLKADSRLFTQEIPRIFYKPKIDVLVHKTRL
jgi:hypothetical protein